MAKSRHYKSHDDESLQLLASALAAELTMMGRTLATAESCTGGLLAKICTDLPGSSEWFRCGLVTYSNRAKQVFLGVDAADIHRFGAVSEEVAATMARGAVEESDADMAVSTTGIAGPDGGTPDKPVGTVCFGWALPGGVVETETHLLAGGRDDVRRASVAVALTGLLQRLKT
ncbi:MAG TPA: CinA family protein [Wenzhouxiangella sp.]|nr:CinA family protein [Wenzhouxiangella sp.]